jgi:hypothetical protein
MWKRSRARRRGFVTFALGASALLAAGSSVISGATASPARTLGRPSASPPLPSVRPIAVLGSDGRVAGHGTRWWVTYQPRHLYDSGGRVPKECLRATVDGKRVDVVQYYFQKPGHVHVTCHLRAGQPAVFPQLITGCSTFPHDHPMSGTGPAGLTRCARRRFKASSHIKIATIVDGTAVDLASHQALSRVQTVHIPKVNAFGVPAGTREQFVADGYILLVAHLPAGRHTVISTVRSGGHAYDATFTLDDR